MDMGASWVNVLVAGRKSSGVSWAVSSLKGLA